MTPKLIAAEPAAFATSVLAVFVADTSSDSNTPVPTPLASDPTLLSAAGRFLADLGFKATLGEALLVYPPKAFGAHRLLFIGAGPAASLDSNKLRQAAGSTVRFAKDRAIRSFAVAVPKTDVPTVEVLHCMAEGIVLADFDSDTYKTDRKDRSLSDVHVLFTPDAGELLAAHQDAFETGCILAASQNFARGLVLEPGNVLTPTELGHRACAMAQEVGIACEMHSTDFLREHKMNAFLAVAQGSAEPPAFLVLRYEPEHPPAADAPTIALVGKGITFDTGGISIKPADGMEKMKYDMAGAATMLGAIRAIALLKPAIRVLCLVCSAENMPSGTAYKPGDIVTAMSGTTIEVMNTDAEGRMVLADGLHYARTLGATHLIDAATLTGACVIALGKRNAGLFSNDEAACQRFQQAAVRTGESFWRLPCTDEYRDDIKSQIADIQNTGRDRWGGAITAAMFLKEFAGNTPWIHLDIAGQAWLDEVRSDLPKGPSGVAVRSIVEWVRSYEA